MSLEYLIDAPRAAAGTRVAHQRRRTQAIAANDGVAALGDCRRFHGGHAGAQ